MTSVLKRVMAAAAILATASLAGCGSSTSAAVSPSVSVSISPAPAPGTILTTPQVQTLLGAAAANLTSFHETKLIATSATDITGEGDVAIVGNHMTMQMTLNMPQVGATELRAVGTAFYIKLNVADLGGKWIKVDLNDKKSSLAQTLGSLATSPTQIFDQYAGGFAGGAFIGTDSVGDQYQIDVDSAAALKHLPSSMASNAIISSAMKGLPRTVKIHVWIKSSLLQRVVLDLGASGAVTITLSEFGKSVHVVAPPLSELTTVPGRG